MTGRDPVLHVTPPTGDVRAFVLVLHGGRARSTAVVRANQLAVLRMRPFAADLHRAGAAHGLAVARLRYRVRGWNGGTASPVADVRWALERLVERHPGVPAALVGHSMGGRAAVHAAGHPSVRAVVGLAPWIEAGDPYVQLDGRRVLFAHGDQDRMTSPRASASFARSAKTVARSVTYVTIRGERHAMLRRAGLWHGVTTGFVLAVLCDVAPSGTVGTESANVVVRSLAGEESIVV